MSYRYIDEAKLDECLVDLIKECYSRHPEEIKKNKDGKVSFRRGFFLSEEGYKYTIWNNNRKEIDSIIKSHSDHDLCTWYVSINKNQDDNLIDWREIDNVSKIMAATHDQSEELLRKIFTCKKSDEEALFNEGIKLWGAHYSTLTYIFFMKDKDRYLPVRPQAFKDRFAILCPKIKTKCLSECSWANYQEFLNIIAEVRDCLRANKHIADPESVSLLDAHSFVWMMWMLDRSLNIHKTEKESLVTDSEGRVIKYYGQRYERSSKLRKKAIAIHGYACAVCGMKFEETYGDVGKQYIEVHHIKPLYTKKGVEHVVNPETDLVCVCSNCHRMIHRKKGEPYTPEELRDIFQSHIK